MEYYTAVKKKIIGNSPCRAISKDKLLEKKKQKTRYKIVHSMPIYNYRIFFCFINIKKL